jgi:AcrR family transcriptional regulator
MSRWEPDARDRLVRAALELFDERGYEDVTVAQIAERAGLTRRTFFRHFTDKREVLFPGENALAALMSGAVTAAPPDTPLPEVIAAALTAVAVHFGPERKDWVRTRQAVVDANTDLRERELLKLAALTTAVTDALRARGVPDPAAPLAAAFTTLAFRTTFAQWLTTDTDFTTQARTTLHTLRTATTTLT